MTAALESELLAARLGWDPDSTLSIPTQLYLGLRQLCISGRLSPGSRLPSTRALGAALGVARGGVVVAYERLAAEGFVCSKVGAGTRVLEQVSAVPGVRLEPSENPPNRRARRLQAIPSLTSMPLLRPFRLGTPALELAPMALWGRLLRAACLQAGARSLDSGDPFGDPGLRALLVERLQRTRGLRCSIDQVAIMSSAQQAFDLLARLLLEPGDVVWTEDPGYPPARATWVAVGARVVPIQVDAEGLDLLHGARQTRRPRLIYVTPSRQFPTAVKMSLRRRIDLLEFSRSHGAVVIEDDYDSEFCAPGGSIPALAGLDEAAQVVYVGSFPSTLFPALRMGYAVLPKTLTCSFRLLRQYADGFPPALIQTAARHFIGEGHFDRHLRRARTLYDERRRALFDAADIHLRGLIEFEQEQAGLSAVGWLPAGSDDRQIALAGRAEELDLTAISPLYQGRPKRHGLLLGFAPFTPAELRIAVPRLGSLLSRFLPRRPPAAPSS
jgi:GntR family transcriptional regulator / MocR family aminotransferase